MSMLKSEFAVSLPWTTDTRGPLRWVFSHVRRNWLLVLLMLVGAIGNAALAAAIPIFTGQAFDAVTGANPNLQVLVTATVLLIVSQAIRSGLQLARNFGSEVLGQRVERDARQELYGSLLGKSMGFHDLRPTGEIMARATNDVRELALMMAPGFNLVIGSGIFLLMPIFVAPRYNPTLVLTPLIFAITYLVSMVFYLRDLQPVTAEVRRTFGIMNGGLAESIDGIATVKGAAQEEAEVQRFVRNATDVRDALIAQGRVEARFLPLLLLGLAAGFALWHALSLYSQGLITVGDVVAYMGLIALFDFPVFTSLFAYSQVASGVSSARRILELIRHTPDLDENEGGHDAPMQGAIRFEHVSFAYDTSGDTQATDDERRRGRPTLSPTSRLTWPPARRLPSSARPAAARARSPSCSTASTTSTAGASWWTASTCATGVWPRCAARFRSSSRTSSSSAARSATTSPLASPARRRKRSRPPPAPPRRTTSS